MQPEEKFSFFKIPVERFVRDRNVLSKYVWRKMLEG